MGLSEVSLISGILIGSIVCSIIWGTLISIRNKNKNKSIEERNGVIRSIAEVQADIDTLLASYRSGLIKNVELRKSLTPKLDSVNRLFKPNMHILDVYYVKYIENALSEYARVAFQKEVHGQSTGSYEVSPDYSDQNVGAPPEKADFKFFDKPDIAAEAGSEEFTFEGADVSKPDIEESLEQSMYENEEPFVLDEVSTIKPEHQEFAFEQEELQFESESEIAREEISGQKPQPFIIEEEQQEVAFEQEQVPPEPESQEVQDEVTDHLSESSYTLFEDEPGFKGEPEGKEDTPAIAEMREEEVSDPVQDSIDFDAGQSEDEEFSMETIMDMELPRQPQAFTSGSTIYRVPPKPQEKVPEISEFEENFMEVKSSISDKTDTDKLNLGGALHETLEIRVGSPEEPVSQQKEPDPEVMDESSTDEEVDSHGSDSAVFEIDIPAQEAQKEPERKADSSDMSVTGDDVASKIDAFFGFK